MYVTLPGPVAATVDGVPVALRGPRHRRLLAALAVGAGRVVPIERLIDAVWPTDPPATARRQIQDLISSLRSTAGAVAAVSGGYRLDAAVDADEFRALVASARTADPDTAGAAVRRALDLWHGDALAGLDCPPLDPVRIALEEARLDATELRIELDLAAGRAAILAGELAGLVAAHPTRERLVLHQMHALHAAGRTADALDAYRRLRTRLAEELGIDPGDEATRRYEAILRADPRLGAHRPAQLPPDMVGFAGRVAESRLLDTLTDPDAAPPALAIVGPGGVGKTALALRWAHRAADRFPDGTLYSNLRGWSTAGPADPVAVLGQFLRALDLAPNGVPPTVDEASALFRTALADRRVLVVLDNAVSAEQVRPLLPTGRSAAVVTSRAELAGLVARDGVRVVRLDMLPPADGLAVLRHAIGAARVDREPAEAARLVALCGGLPLALRIAAAHLATGPERPIAPYVAELGHGDRLAMLELIGDEQNGLRAVFDRSFEAVTPDAQRMFRLVGASPTVDVPVGAAAALAGVSEADARALCDQLVAANLAQSTAERRVAVHDLLRLHASHVVDPAELRDGVHRLLTFRFARSDAAARLLYPARLRLPDGTAPAGPAAMPGWTVDAALAWLDAEQENLVTAIRYAAEHGPVEYSWHLTDALRGYFGLRVDLGSARDAVRAAPRAAADAGDLAGGCVAELCFGEMVTSSATTATARSTPARRSGSPSWPAGTRARPPATPTSPPRCWRRLPSSRRNATCARRWRSGNGPADRWTRRSPTSASSTPCAGGSTRPPPACTGR